MNQPYRSVEESIRFWLWQKEHENDVQDASKDPTPLSLCASQSLVYLLTSQAVLALASPLS